MLLAQVLLILLLIPGVLLSLPPGPNKKWVMGGQVTWTNALVHAVAIAFLLPYASSLGTQ
jgi:hypothetical protein